MTILTTDHVQTSIDFVHPAFTNKVGVMWRASRKLADYIHDPEVLQGHLEDTAASTVRTGTPHLETVDAMIRLVAFALLYQQPDNNQVLEAIESLIAGAHLASTLNENSTD
jgi:hypothetical protein